MALTDVPICPAKPSESDKARKLTGNKGLRLPIQPNGGRLWRMIYRFDGKQKTLALATYPDTGFARERRNTARKPAAQ